jgi:hypothetical protein
MKLLLFKNTNYRINKSLKYWNNNNIIIAWAPHYFALPMTIKLFKKRLHTPQCYQKNTTKNSNCKFSKIIVIFIFD